jgi:hypothetical protein
MESTDSVPNRAVPDSVVKVKCGCLSTSSRVSCAAYIPSYLKNKMKYEKHRLESFKHWPIPWLCVRDFAANGFYFTGFDDKVECVFCRALLGRWEAEDDVETEHRKWSPHCPFIRGEKTENIPLKTPWSI